MKKPTLSHLATRHACRLLTAGIELSVIESIEVFLRSKHFILSAYGNEK